jgi:hypothetical protein
MGFRITAREADATRINTEEVPGEKKPRNVSGVIKGRWMIDESTGRQVRFFLPRSV